MSRTADCYEKAAMASFFHSFQGECIDGAAFSTRAQARNSPFEDIEGLLTVAKFIYLLYPTCIFFSSLMSDQFLLK